MKSRLAAIALILAALAGVGGFVRTTTGLAAVDRLNRWFDDRHGIGEPCGDRELTIHKGAYGVVLDIPRCWTAVREDVDGLPTETLTDPGLRQNFIVRYVPRSDPGSWRDAMAVIEGTLKSPYADVAVVRGWRVVRNASQGPGAGQPNRFYEWAASNEQVALFAVFGVNKFYVDSPRIVGFGAAIDRVVRSIRWEESVSDAAGQESR